MKIIHGNKVLKLNNKFMAIENLKIGQYSIVHKKVEIGNVDRIFKNIKNANRYK